MDGVGSLVEYNFAANASLFLLWPRFPAVASHLRLILTVAATCGFPNGGARRSTPKQLHEKGDRRKKEMIFLYHPKNISSSPFCY
jgi:hypothetical protein